jgi:hypothetical protein
MCLNMGRRRHDCLANLAQGTLCKILNDQEIKPHEVRYYLERRDREFKQKMAEIANTAPDLPPQPGAHARRYSVDRRQAASAWLRSWTALPRPGGRAQPPRIQVVGISDFWGCLVQKTGQHLRRGRSEIPHSTQPRAPAVNRLDAVPPAVGVDRLPAWSAAKTMASGIFHLAAPRSIAA